MGHLLGGSSRGHAQKLIIRPGGVCQRSQQIEQRAKPQNLANRHRVLHRSMTERGEAKPDAQLIHATADLFGRKLHVHAQRFQHIGGTAGTGDAAVAVLGHRHARRSRDQGGGGADVEGVQFISAGAAGIEQALASGGDARGASDHRPGRPHDFGNRFALHPQRRQEGREQPLVRFAAHDFADRGLHHLRGNIFALHGKRNRLPDVTGHRTCLTVFKCLMTSVCLKRVGRKGCHWQLVASVFAKKAMPHNWKALAASCQWHPKSRNPWKQAVFQRKKIHQLL